MENKFKIRSEKGIVKYAMRTGEVFVKSTMFLAYANRIMNTGKSVELSDKRGYGMEICVDDHYFFPADIEPDTEVADIEPDTDEVTDNE